MKKYLSLLLALVMILAMFAGCGSNDNADDIAPWNYTVYKSNGKRNILFPGAFLSDCFCRDYAFGEGVKQGG